MRESERKRLERAKASLMLTHPFFGALATTLQLQTDDDIPSFTTQENRLRLNSDYLADRNDEELIFILANAALHQAEHYQKRRANRREWLWYLATDYTINAILLQNNLTPPPDINYEKAFEGAYAEEIYQTLKQRIKNQEERDEDQEEDQRDEPQENRSHPLKQDQGKITEKIDPEWIDTLLMRYQDRLPQSLDHLLKLPSKSRIDWKAKLFAYINAHAINDYRMFPPNKKFLYQGIALPSLYGQKLEIAVAIDTSASISPTLLEAFLNELYTIMQAFNHYEILLIECDDKIRNIQRLHPSDPLKSQFHTGGGTDFRPVFDYLAKEGSDLKFLIYFSDGEGIFPDYLPPIETLWILPTEKQPPFGESITL